MFSCEFFILSMGFCSSFSSHIFELKANLVFTQLNSPMSIRSNMSTISACVGNAMIALDRNRWMQLLSELAEEQFCRLYGNFLNISVVLFSKTSQNMIVSWKLYMPFRFDNFVRRKNCQNFFKFSKF